MQNQPASQAQEERENRPFQPSLAGSVPAAVQTGKNWLMELHEHMYADSEQTDNQSVPICMYRAWLEGAWLAGATQDGFIHDRGRSMYLPTEWDLRIRETTLLGDSATTTRRAGLGCAQMGSSVD